MTQRKYTNRRYLDALEKKVLVFDGAMAASSTTAATITSSSRTLRPWRKSTARFSKWAWT